MTFLYVLHVFALMTQSYSASRVGDDIRSASPLLCGFIEVSRLTSLR